MIFTTINGKYQWHLRLYVGIICTTRWNLELNSKITTSKSREIANYIKLLFFHRTSARSWCPPLASQLHCCYYCRHQFPPLSFFICNCWLPPGWLSLFFVFSPLSTICSQMSHCADNTIDAIAPAPRYYRHCSCITVPLSPITNYCHKWIVTVALPICYTFLVVIPLLFLPCHGDCLLLAITIFGLLPLLVDC